jgi:hypothetical protein
MESLGPVLSKVTKAKMIEEVVFIYLWLSGIKPFQTQTYIFRQGLLLKEKMTTFTGSKHVL